MVKEYKIIIATSECRLSETQLTVANLGVIVNKDYQGKGIATKILYQQARRAQEVDKKPVFSTTYNNIASRKAIEKAGFYSANIIFDISSNNQIQVI